MRCTVASLHQYLPGRHGGRGFLGKLDLAMSARDSGTFIMGPPKLRPPHEANGHHSGAFVRPTRERVRYMALITHKVVWVRRVPAYTEDP